MREEEWLKVYEDGVLRRIFRLTKDEVTGEWRTLQTRRLTICAITQ
jgi:hypothetical protein